MSSLTIEVSGDALVATGDGIKIEKVGDIVYAETNGLHYYAVGCINKFEVFGRCKSLRLARVKLKAALAEVGL